jgi:hypothetical protein
MCAKGGSKFCDILLGGLEFVTECDRGKGSKSPKFSVTLYGQPLSTAFGHATGEREGPKGAELITHNVTLTCSPPQIIVNHPVRCVTS